MNNRKPKRKSKATFRFHGADFHAIRAKQEGKCALTGRKLTGITAEIELREPYKEVGIEELSNHYLVDRSVSFLARHVDEMEIIDIAAEIIKYRGAEKGYKLILRKGRQR